MLSRICFILQEETRKGLTKAAGPLLKELENSVQVEGLMQPFMEIVYTDVEKNLQYLKQMVQNVEMKEQILYITDEIGYYGALREAGCYVLPYLHDGNREVSFPGAVYAIEQLEEMEYKSFDMAYRRLAGLPWEILRTRRCIIRETTVEDVGAFYRIYAEDSITKYMENLFEDPEEEIAYTKDYIKRVYGFYGYGMWTVLEKKSGQVIGRAGVSWREGFDLPELGFVIGVPWQRQGYAYEVCSAILDYAREELAIDRVQALVMEKNRNSAALCGKLGFVESSERAQLDGVMYVKWVKSL